MAVYRPNLLKNYRAKEEMSPQISVIMSVFNCEKYIGEAIKSILTQSFVDFEFVIISDGSTDRSDEIILSFKDERIKFNRFNKQGLAKSLNWGIQNASGKYIARMDADDIAFPTRLEKQYNYLEANPEYVAVGCHARVIDKNGEFIYDMFLPTDYATIEAQLPYIGLYHSCTFYKRSDALKINCYPEDFLISQDKVFFNKLSKLGKMTNIDEILMYYRVTPGANSIRTKKMQAEQNRIINNYLVNGCIDEKDRQIISDIYGKRKPSLKNSYYHLFLAKKYLWNNYSLKRAVKNSLLSIRYQPYNYQAYILIAGMLVPSQLIKYLYKKFKKYE